MDLFCANHGRFQVNYEQGKLPKSSIKRCIIMEHHQNSEIINKLKVNDTCIDEKSLSHISLLPYKHVIPMGAYFIDKNKKKFED